MVKARARAAKAAKRAAGIKPKKQTAVKKAVKRTTPARKVAAKKVTVKINPQDLYLVEYSRTDGTSRIHRSVDVHAKSKTEAIRKAKERAAANARGFSATLIRKRTERVAPKRKRNLDHQDAKHPIAVTKHWRAGGASQWQRAHAAGQKQLFSMNPQMTAAEKAALKVFLSFGYQKQPIAIKQTDKWGRWHAVYADGKTANDYSFHGSRDVSGTVRDALRGRGKSANPGAAKGKALFKEFAGRPARKVSRTYAPKGSGAKGTLGAMGKLVKIKVRGRTALDFTPTKAILARDAKNQMYVLGRGYKLNLKGKRHNPTGFEDLGQIDAIEYEATKSHLDGVPTIYVHKMGEEGGARPHLLVNEEGLAIISGGEYSIDERGIIN